MGFHTNAYKSRRYTSCMDRTINIPIPYDEDIIKTLEMATEAYSLGCSIGFENKPKNRNEMHKLVYRRIRDCFPELNADLVCQNGVSRALESLRGVKFKRCPEGNRLSARYAHSTCTFFESTNVLSIATINGRKKFDIQIPDWAKERYPVWKFKTIVITHDDKKGTIVHMVIEIPDVPKSKSNKVLGIDRGVNNIAVCSDGSFFNSKHLRNVKGRYQHQKQTLQSKGTKSAKRKLKRLSGKETRFVRDVNHCLSKKIANLDFDVFVLEDLKGIKNDKCHTLNKRLGSWSPYQFQQFLEYKAEALGKEIVYVKPAYTSQRCSKCGHTEKGNRKGSKFQCRECGHTDNADLNASYNIAKRGMLLLAGRIQPSECLNDSLGTIHGAGPRGS